jgi:diaminopimelate decarboxylase
MPVDQTSMQFGKRDGHLTLDGADLVALADQYGSPLFVFSERQLRANASSFLKAARGGHPRAVVCYASKACSNLHVLKLIREEGLDIEINSGGELHKALAAGFAPQQMVFNGVAKSVAELHEAIALQIRAINVDSPFELRRIAEIASSIGRRAAISLRLIPGIAGGATPGIQTGNVTSKFGMTQEELAEALEIIATYRSSLDVVGMHLHIGSQVTETDAFLAGVKFAATQASALAGKLGAPLRLVNLGGGYPTDYAHQRPTLPRRPGSNELDHFAAPLSAAAMVGEVATAARHSLGADVDVLFEPGRSLVADCAVLLSRVESKRQRGGLPWLYLDAGYNLLLDSASVRWYYHMQTANRIDAAETADFRVVGPLCDSADCFFDVEGEYLLQSLLKRLPELTPDQQQILRSEVVRLPASRPLARDTRPGDIIALHDVGAYSLEEMFQYCGRLRAAAVMIGSDDRIRVIRSRDDHAALMRHERSDDAA